MNEKVINKMMKDINSCSEKLVNSLLNDYKYNDPGEVGEMVSLLTSEFESLLHEKIMERISQLAD